MNVVLLVTLVYVVGHPGGILQQEWHDWRASAATKKAIAAHWDQLFGGRGQGERVLVEFMDYQCPACRAAEDSVTAYASQLGFRLVRRQLPIAVLHPSAEAAAIAVLCAQDQDQFIEMDSFLMRSRAWQTENFDWSSAARAGGIVDVPAFVQCLGSGRQEPTLERDRALARELGIHGTPTFVGPKRMASGLPTGAILADLLRQ